jgi:hypothetical protein
VPLALADSLCVQCKQPAQGEPYTLHVGEDPGGINPRTLHVEHFVPIGVRELAFCSMCRGRRRRKLLLVRSGAAYALALLLLFDAVRSLGSASAVLASLLGALLVAGVGTVWVLVRYDNATEVRKDLFRVHREELASSFGRDAKALHLFDEEVWRANSSAKVVV